MKKKVISLILAMVLLVALCVPAAAANIRTEWTDITYRGIKIVINDVEIAPCDEKGNSTEPFIMNDTTYLPVRAIAGALGLNVGWEAATSTVVLEKGGEANYGNGRPVYSFDVKHVSITYRGTKISLDGENIPLVNRNGESVEPFIYNGTNYLPLRVVSEALGLSVGWDGATSTVTLKGGNGDNTESEPKPEPTPTPDPEPIVPAPPTETTWRLSQITYTGGITGNSSSFYEMGKLTYEYDSFGRLVRVYTPTGNRKIVCTYNKYGRVETAETFIHGDTKSYMWKYDKNGELAAFYENGRIQEGYYAEYDEAGRMVAEDFVSEYGSSHNKYTYDEEGRLIVSELWGYMSRRTFYIYDEQGFLLRCEHDNGTGKDTFEEYSYDEQGRVATKREEVGYDGIILIHNYVYDELGRVATDTCYREDTGYLSSKVEYEYDENGVLIRQKSSSAVPYTNNQGVTEIVEELSSDEEFFTYDAQGRLLEYKKLSRMSYHDAELDKYVLGDDHSEYIESYEYDSAGRLTKLSEKTVDSVNRNIYQLKEYINKYDDAGRLIEDKYVHSGSHTPKSAEQWTWTYDAQGRLIGEKYYELNSAYETWEKWTYTYKGDNLKTTEYANSDGSKITESYSYDYYGKLTTITTNDNGAKTVSSLKYDGNGNNTKLEIKSYSDNATIIAESSYVLVPKTEIDPLILEYVAIVETLF